MGSQIYDPINIENRFTLCRCWVACRRWNWCTGLDGCCRIRWYGCGRPGTPSCTRSPPQSPANRPCTRTSEASTLSSTVRRSTPGTRGSGGTPTPSIHKKAHKHNSLHIISYHNISAQNIVTMLNSTTFNILYHITTSRMRKQLSTTDIWALYKFM